MITIPHNLTCPLKTVTPVLNTPNKPGVRPPQESPNAVSFFLATDCGQCVIVVLLDLTSISDTADDQTLLSPLDGHSGSCFCVRLGATDSSVAPLTCGVPQGSILGPMSLGCLYIMYFNDKKAGAMPLAPLFCHTWPRNAAGPRRSCTNFTWYRKRRGSLHLLPVHVF